jgi:hypothetical protein
MPQFSHANLQAIVNTTAFHRSIPVAARAIALPERTVIEALAQARAAGIRPSSVLPELVTLSVDAYVTAPLTAKLQAAPQVLAAVPAAPVAPTTAEQLVTRRTEASEKADSKHLRKLLDAADEEVAELRALNAHLMALDAEPKTRHEIPVYQPHNGEGMFVGVASDWHIEEQVRPETLDGYTNEYNLEISKARSEKFFQSYVYMLDAWRHVGKCDVAVLAILGDIISGYIHDDLMESNLLSPTQASLRGQDYLSSGIDHILSHGNLERLIVPCCFGNHGRTTEKRRIQTGAANSYEYVMYQQMKREWRAEPRVEFVIAEGYHLNMDLCGTRTRFHHGDSMKYGGGIGGLTIPTRKKIAAWNSGNSRPAALDVFGHFHQLMDGGNFIVNGSLIGYGPYAVEVGASFERPRQACFWLDPKRGKTMFGELYVE